MLKRIGKMLDSNSFKEFCHAHESREVCGRYSQRVPIMEKISKQAKEDLKKFIGDQKLMNWIRKYIFGNDEV
jgi:hypothetical protein